MYAKHQTFCGACMHCKTIATLDCHCTQLQPNHSCAGCTVQLKVNLSVVLQLPDQILDPEERRNSIFVDRNNQYDLREARDEEQASLQLDAADQKKFGGAFVKFPKVSHMPRVSLNVEFFGYISINTILSTPCLFFNRQHCG